MIQKMKMLGLLAAVLASALSGRAGAQEVAKGPDAPFTRSAAQAILRDARKIPEPRGVEELEAVEIGGVRQWISVRGRDRRNPILLFVHGGPGSPEMPASWLYQAPWEDYFTVVQWDQRGAGKTAAANDAEKVTPTIGVERMVSDGEELVAYLRKTYGKQKIFVLGHSWGTVIGLRLAQRHPEWLHGYIGMGQVIYGPDNERLSYEFALRQARKRGDREAIGELQALAPYPGPAGSVTAGKIVTERKWIQKFGGLNWDRDDYFQETMKQLSPEYTDEDVKQDGVASIVALLPELSAIDFRSVKTLSCPIFIFAGRYDYETPSALAVDWLAGLHAPRKQIFWFEHSAHMMQFEQPGAVFLHLVRDIRPLAAAVGDAAPDDAPGAGG